MKFKKKILVSLVSALVSTASFAETCPTVDSISTKNPDGTMNINTPVGYTLQGGSTDHVTGATFSFVDLGQSPQEAAVLCAYIVSGGPFQNLTFVKFGSFSTSSGNWNPIENFLFTCGPGPDPSECVWN